MSNYKYSTSYRRSIITAVGEQDVDGLYPCTVEFEDEYKDSTGNIEKSREIKSPIKYDVGTKVCTAFSWDGRFLGVSRFAKDVVVEKQKGTVIAVEDNGVSNLRKYTVLYGDDGKRCEVIGAAGLEEGAKVTIRLADGNASIIGGYSIGQYIKGILLSLLIIGPMIAIIIIAVMLK
ncbi:MAG: hypothetical protein K5987_06725 [Lachnospiraceae bacterium]|nr:hypothetical protein [Lachnospiraceae bacterium]